MQTWTLPKSEASSEFSSLPSFPFRYTVWGDKAGNKTVFIPYIFLMIIFLSLFYTCKIWTFMIGILGMMMQFSHSIALGIMKYHCYSY